MSQQSDAWPSCPEPEVMFGKALLLYGPIPEKGWRITRNAANQVTSIYGRGREARALCAEAEKLFYEDIKKRYSVRNWKDTHMRMVAKMWKNEFLWWVWDEIDNR